MPFYGTRQVAQMLGITTGTLTKAVWDYRIPAPQKGPGAAYHWTEADIQRASWRLLGRSADEALAAYADAQCSGAG